MVDLPMELRRHIDQWLLEWKNRKERKPALVKGIRQSGKTHSIKNFCDANYSVSIYLNFWDNHDLATAFDGDLNAESVIKALSTKMDLPELKKGSTVFFLDEVQECPRALLFLKTVGTKSGYDFIASGSYLGIKGYVVGDSTPYPVGSTFEFDMRTLDFEEFLWAYGYKDEQVAMIKDAFAKRKPLSTFAHNIFTKLFREYCCVGGFPEAIVQYIESKNLRAAVGTVRKIIGNLQDDFGRRVDRNGQPLFKPNEVARIREAFSLIPFFLAKENKRYVVSKIEAKGAKDGGKDALSYLVDAGMAFRVSNLSVPSIPLAINVIRNQYKIFPADIGMLTAMLEEGVVSALFEGEMGFGKGMFYEAVVAEALYKRGGRSFYFAKDTGLELDFVVNLEGKSTILEVKAVNGNAKSAKTVMAHPEHYGKTNLIKVASSNLSMNNGILTIPHYMAFLLFDWHDLMNA